MIYKSVSVALLFTMGILHTLGLGEVNLHFQETFDSDDALLNGKWFLSGDGKYKDQPVKIQKANIPIAGFENDKGIQLTQEMKYYAFGSKFATPLDPKDDGDIVIQYEVKLEEPLACGGAYVKLPRSSPELQMSNLNNDTPYTIMFGPDKCGTNNKVHFILQFQNPVSSEWEEKHFNETIPMKSDQKVHLYTLVVRRDNTFQILVDSNAVATGGLLTHMVPPINPPATIPDANDVKPSDWVDDPMMDDPTASKPLDWDEEAPRKIPDPKAVKPAAWEDDAPLQIPDPEAVKPEDWDDEEDGEWEAPLVDNPLCDKVGCGPWAAPTIVNPAYKGKWRAPKIPNPAFKGVWAPRQVPNPSHFETQDPFASLAPMAGIAVEVWTTSAGIHFDNFVVARSLNDALAFARETFKPKAEAERQQLQQAEREKRAAERQELLATGSMRAVVEVKATELVEWFTENPLALGASIAVLLLSVLYLIVGGSRRTDSARTESASHVARGALKTEGEQQKESTTSVGGADVAAAAAVSASTVDAE